MKAERRALLAERSARQGLAGDPARSVVAAVRRALAVQAQDAAAARLGVRVRAPGTGIDDGAVATAYGADRAVVRTWLMRGTVHLVDAADLRWLVRLLGPAVQRRFRTRWHQLGLTDELLDRSVAALAEELADGPLTRAQVRERFTDRGLTAETTDRELHTHVLLHASTTALVCRSHDGPARGGRDSTFALLEQWLPDAPAGPSGDDALAELARRYFAAFAPATAADFTAWSGLGSGRAVELIRDELEPADVDGRPGFRPRDGLVDVGAARGEGGVRLLPAFDNYLLGYRDRDAIVAPPFQPRVYQGGMIRPVVLRDGAAVATWSLDRAAARVVVEPFAPLPQQVVRGVRREVADVGRFVGRDLELRFEP